MNQKYIARSTEIAARELDGEMIIMSAADSSLFTLNEQATAIQVAADGVTRLREIAERALGADFEVDAESFVDELAGHGVLLLSDRPIAARNKP